MADFWPTSQAERDLYADWQEEVQAGDTILGFRTWLNARS